MYFFVRFTAIVAIIFGILLMLAGVAMGLYGFFQNAALVGLMNTYIFEGSNFRMVDARLVAALIGAGLLGAGMLAAALGQLMMAVLDLANNTRETNILLRGLAGDDGE